MVPPPPAAAVVPRWRDSPGSAMIPSVDDAIELSSLLASLEDITKRISALVERHNGTDGVDAELVALERSLSGSVRRLRRAARSADRRR